MLALRGDAPVMGCRWCGVVVRHHGTVYVPGHWLHIWEQPTRAQIVARIRVNFGKESSAWVFPKWRA